MTEKKPTYKATIGDEELLVDPNIKPGDPHEGEIVYDVDDDPERGPHPDTDALSEDPDLSAAMRPLPTTPQYKGIPPPGSSRMCANDRCTNMVPISENIGVEKKFCSRGCAHKYHNRMHERRQREKAGWFLERHRISGAQLHFARTRPKDVAQATRRYKSHLNPEVCPNATGKKRCPSHVEADYYSERRLCLPYAVLVDDLYEQLALARGELYLRRWTTEDGRWAEKSDLPHLEHTRGEGER